MTEESIEELPARKKPNVKKPAVKKAAAKRAVAKPVPVVEEPLTSVPKTISLKNFAAVLISAVLVSAIAGYQVGSQKSDNNVTTASTSTFTDIVAGKVALTESELIAAVKKIGVTAYWAGPVKGAKYTLSVPSDGQAYIRYLPNGEGLTDTNPNYVVIATYATTNAFEATQSAGNQTNGITFVNTDGAAVYYHRTTATNVYLAYPGKNFQIEIFDPIAKTALEIASKSGAIRLVE